MNVRYQYILMGILAGRVVAMMQQAGHDGWAWAFVIAWGVMYFMDPETT